MKRFHFNLEAVRTLRQRAEREALEKYAEAILARSMALERVERAREELGEAWAKLREVLITGAAAGDLERLRSFCKALEEVRAMRESELQGAEVGLHRALQLMLHARREREAVDQFRAAQRQAHDRALSREEQKFLDELAGQRAALAAIRKAA